MHLTLEGALVLAPAASEVEGSMAPQSHEFLLRARQHPCRRGAARRAGGRRAAKRKREPGRRGPPARPDRPGRPRREAETGTPCKAPPRPKPKPARARSSVVVFGFLICGFVRGVAPAPPRHTWWPGRHVQRSHSQGERAVGTCAVLCRALQRRR